MHCTSFASWNNESWWWISESLESSIFGTNKTFNHAKEVAFKAVGERLLISL